MSQYLATAQGVFGSNGEIVVSVGPERAREGWRVTNLATRSASVCRLKVYRNVVGSSLLDQTTRGDNDVSPCDYDIPPGQRLVFHYTNGTPGVSALCDIEGVRYHR